MTPKDYEVKRKHHYVWARYLKAWASGNNVHYISKKGLPATDSVKGLAQEQGFYKITSFDDDDLQYILSMSRLADDGLQKLHLIFLKDFIKISAVLKSRARFLPNDDDKAVNHLQYNILENIHSGVERKAWPIISALRLGNTEILEDRANKANFCHYIAQQLARTKVVRDQSIAASIRNELPDQITEKMKKNWWFLSFMLGINLGRSLLESPANKHILIENKSGIPFITSDRPVINLHSSMQTRERDKPPEGLDLYYPLSPTHAYMINDTTDFDHFRQGVTSHEVAILNESVAKHCGETVYGSTREAILKLKSHIDYWRR